MDSCVGNHKSSDVHDSVHDLSGLEVDVDADERKEPERDEDRHHISNGIPKKRNFKDYILKRLKF